MNDYEKARMITKGIIWELFTWWIIILVAIGITTTLWNFFNLETNDTDKDGFHRSGFSLLTDYGTGKQYLYRGGVIVERAEKKGNQ